MVFSMTSAVEAVKLIAQVVEILNFLINGFQVFFNDMVGTNEFVLLSALHNICKGLDLTQRKIKRAAVTDKKQASEVSRSVDTVIGIRSGRTGNEIVVLVKTNRFHGTACFLC